MPTVLTDDALRAAIIRAAEQGTPGRPRHPGAWVPKPPVLPCIPLRSRRAPRMQVQGVGKGRPLCQRGVQLSLFDPNN